VLSAVDRRIGLLNRLTVAITDSRDARYITHTLRDLLTQRIFQIASGNAMIMKRVLRLLRQHWPQTHILLRGDGHFSGPELMQLIIDDGNADFIFGLTGNAVLSRKAEGLMRNARGHLDLHRSLAAHGLGPDVAAMRLFGEFEYAAKSWSKPHRVVLKAEVLAGSDGKSDKDNKRFVVTTLRSPTPQAIYQQEYCARGQAENWIKQVKCDLKSDRTLASTFLGNFARLLLTAAAYVLHQQLRQLELQGTALAIAQPKTVILSLFKIAVRVKQYKDRALLHLPSACPVKALLAQVCQRLAQPAENLPCWLLHDPARLAHETAPPTLINNPFTLRPASGGWGTIG
jgi:hypothetical protein